ncbi:MAG TPA: tetratricopeptide repeat protein [Rickettsiales bacterium]|nr:tetratricopeptide repeat protein [Rickettsiales bacterium]
MTPAFAQAEQSPAAPAPKGTPKDAIPFGDYLAGKFAESSGDSQKSIKFLQESLARDPNNQDVLSNLYREYIAEGNITQAVATAQKLGGNKTLDDGNDFSPNLLLCTEAVKRGDFAAAEKFLQSVPKTGFNTLLVPLMEAWLKLGNKEIKAALNAKDIMHNDKMMLPDIYLNAAYINEIAGFGPEALQQYETAANDPNVVSLRALEALANYYARHDKKDKYKQLVDSYTAVHGETILAEDALGSQPPKPLVANASEGLAEAFYTIAGLFHGVRAPTDEITTLKIALFLRPDFAAAQFLLASTYELERDYKHAIETYRSIAKDSPYGIQAQIMAAYDKSELGDKPGAVSDLDAIAQQHPTMVSALLAKGDILRIQGQYAQAIESYDAALVRLKTPQKPNWIIFFSRGICYDKLGQFEKTEQDMQSALKLSPEDPDVLNYLGYSWLTKHRNIAQAKKMISEAYDARPEDAQIIDSMGFALYSEGDFKDAQEYFEQALERIPDDPTVNEHLGDTYWQLGRKTEAGYQWRRALDYKPDEQTRNALMEKLAHGLAPIAPISKADAKKTPKSLEVQ